METVRGQSKTSPLGREKLSISTCLNTFAFARKTSLGQPVVSVLSAFMVPNASLVLETLQILRFVGKTEYVMMEFMGQENAFAKIQILIQNTIVNM